MPRISAEIAFAAVTARTNPVIADRYSSVETLRRREVEGRDFRVVCVGRESSVLILAPHAGGIEPGTSEIAQAIAGNEYSVYCFEGIKSSGNKPLHVTSTRFRDPQCDELLAEAEQVIAIHGEQSETENVFIGGLNRELCDKVSACLGDAGFHVDRESRPDLAGADSHNVCNRGKTGKGVQLELGATLRSTFFAHLATRAGRQEVKEPFRAFVAAIRAALGALTCPPKLEG